MPADAVIINADDLGLWPSVDKGIFDAWTAGVISDSSVFATAPNLPEVLRRATAFGLPVGVHLNLTNGAPLSNPRVIPGLVTEEGRFMKRRQWQRPVSKDQIRREFLKQIEAVMACGVQPSHLDCHHHVQLFMEVQEVLVEMAERFSLPVRAVDPIMRDIIRESGINTPDHFSMQFYNVQATVETLIELVESTPNGVLEIMCHPGYEDANCPSSYNEERARELIALTDPRWRTFMAARGIRLIGYEQLSTDTTRV
ncbi:MAG: hypothetical protein BWY76_00064 [bacterium ADurb.Bin429]|nr:MAG: hypothetical protein BWY76_00064 [bacterium ADurb.Bin429]